MVKEHKKPNAFLNPQNPFDSQVDPEVELAFAIQNASPGDPQLLEILVESYSEEVFRLVSALIAARGDEDQLSRKICTIVEETFAEAYRNPDRFRGENGVRTWLFKLAINRIRQDRLLGHLEWLWHKQPSERSWAKVVKTQPRGEQNALIWHSAGNLPFRARLIVVLRYVYGMDLAEITDLLGIPPARLTKHLTRFRRSCQLLEQDGRGSISHPHYRKLIDQSVDGLLNEDPYRREQLDGHLFGCQSCQSYAQELQALEKTLSQSLRECWPMPSLEGFQLEDLREAAQGERFDHPQRNRSILTPLFRGSWIVAGMLAAASLIWGLTQLSDIQYEKVFPPTRTPTQLPPRSAINSPTIRNASALESQASAEMAAHLMSSISSNGRWITFSSLEFSFGSDQSRFTSKYYLYDQASHSLEALPIPVSDLTPAGIFMQSLISGDGRYVAYNKPVGDNLGIELYDREDGSIQAINPLPGATKTGVYDFLAGISENGRWILYWSSDKSLDTSKKVGCLSKEVDGCQDLFIYDQETGSSTRIPIGRQGTENFSSFRSSISADGRWISLTVYNSDLITDQLNLQHQYEALLYDRQMEEFQSLNVSGSGDPGNGDSYLAAIASDGGFVAFTSTSSNLVPDDTNNSADVFVRDLASGTLERVSLSTNGEQGEGESGLFQGPLGLWGENIGISSDGRYISFISEAQNLASLPVGGCPSRVSPSNFSPSNCISIYLHDRQTRQTQRVTPLVNSEESAFLFMDLSADGRWLTYTELNPDCNPNSNRQVCAEIWLYDQQNQWTSPLTKGILPVPSSSWRSENSYQTFGNGISSLTLSPDGQTIAIGYYDGDIRLLNKNDGTTQTLQSKRPATSVSSLDFFPDGEFLAAGRKNGTVEIWRLSDGTNLYTIENNAGGVIHAEFSAQTNILSISTPHTISFWQLQGKFFVNVKQLQYPEGFLKDLALSPTGEWLAAATAEDTVWLVQVPSGQVSLRLDNLDENLSQVAFSPRGDLLAAGSSDGSLNLWGIENSDRGELQANYLQTLKLRRLVNGISFSKDGKILAAMTSGGGFYLWNLPDGSPAANPLWNGANREASGLMVFNGETLAIINTGNIQIFQRNEISDNARFFTFSQDNHYPSGSLSSANLGLAKIKGFTLSLYQADMISDFDLRAPTYMPPGVTFTGCDLPENGSSAVLHYQYQEQVDSKPSIDIYLFQHALGSPSPEFLLGSDAIVQSVKIANRNAEYVQGGWVYSQNELSPSQRMSPVSALVWDPQAPFQWLRWQDGDVLLTILVKASEGNPQGISYFNEADLIDIAASVMKLSRTSTQNPILVTYTIQPGDTCTDIAARYGVTVGEIMRLNKLTNNCDYIFAGETLKVPLTDHRITMSETDMNCDGKNERIRLIPIPGGYITPLVAPETTIDRISYNYQHFIEDPLMPLGPQSMDPVFGVVVETLSPLGFYQEVWHYTIADTGDDFFYFPRLVDSGGCEVYLSVSRLGEGNQLHHEVFSWNGFGVDLVQGNSP